MTPRAFDSDTGWLTPREVADILGVRPATVASWARAGRLDPAIRTPGGHRRYRRTEILKLRDDRRTGDSDLGHEQMKRDVVRLYEQGWSIRRVAEEFGFSYGKTRRILRTRTSLRDR